MYKKNTKGVSMKSKFFFNLDSIQPQLNFPGGTLVNVTSDQVPGFENISFTGMKLKSGGALAPIWHPKAHKIGYCIKGNSLVSIRTPGTVETFSVQAGDMFFIPKGYIHQITNIGDQEAVIKFAYNNTKPEVMSLCNAIHSISDSVFTATFDSPKGFQDPLKKSQSQEVIKMDPSTAKPSNLSGKFKFNVANSTKTIVTKGGYLQLGTKGNLPTLDGLGILRFGLTPGGVVEPHWHTNAGELVYIVKGQTRITVLTPDGNIDVLEVKGGQGAFAPASFFHNIENIGNDEVEVIAFFSHAEPDYIGIGEALGSYSNQVLGSVFNVSANYFDALKKPTGPLVIVPLK
jgi:oxalate decarboxylase